jgi:hypothetical protein
VGFIYFNPFNRKESKMRTLSKIQFTLLALLLTIPFSAYGADVEPPTASISPEDGSVMSTNAEIVLTVEDNIAVDLDNTMYNIKKDLINITNDLECKKEGHGTTQGSITCDKSGGGLDAGEYLVQVVPVDLAGLYGTTVSSEFTVVSSSAFLTLTPDATRLVRGFTLGIQATITNNTNEVQTVLFATKVKLPNGNFYPPSGYLFGPLEVTLDPYQSVTEQPSLEIPCNAPLGTYVYHGYIGTGVGIIDEDQFEFEVVETIPAPVPKTGLTISYADYDDGYYEKGVAWPIPRFTDNNNGTVTDNLTGLIWLKDANCFGTRAWSDALSDCNGLASGQCGLTDGSTEGDWRLPNVKELQSLIDYGEYWPALPSGDPFTNVQSSNYWSSTTFAPSTDNAWLVVMFHGGLIISNKSSSFYVWPVRGGY